MKAQAQRMQVAEDFQRNLAHCALRDAGEEKFAELGEQRGGKSTGYRA